MKITRLLLFSILVCTSMLGSAWASEPIVITHVTVINVTGGAPQTDVNVFIDDARITSIGTGAPPAKATLVDGRGKYLIPGLWDMHVHLSPARDHALPLLVANGVTGVRDLGGHLSELDAWRAKIAAHVQDGPRIFRAGPSLNGEAFNSFQLAVGTPEESRGIVRALKQIGVDFIKVHRRTPRESYYAILDEARKQGLNVVGHIPMAITPEEASDAGQHTIEHIVTPFEGTFTATVKDNDLGAAVRRFRESGGAAALFARFVKNHNYFDPTLSTYRSIIDAIDPGTPLGPNRKYLAASVLKKVDGKAKTATPEQVAKQRAVFAELMEIAREAHRAGVTMLAGTDIADEPRIAGFMLHDELELLVQAGLTPLEALQAATINCTRSLGQEKDLGSIEPGKIADVVLLDANPLDDIRNTRRIRAVIANGKLYRRAALDGLLRLGEELAKHN